jgi:hypothetical protein
VTEEDRRRALAARHRLAPAHRADGVLAVARSLVALHGTDPASVHLAIAARTSGPGASVEDIDAALYRDRTIVRVMGMRRTMWVVPADLVPVVAGAAGAAVAADERRKLVRLLEEQGVAADGTRWLAGVEEEVLAALSARGEAVTTELATEVPALKGTVVVGGTSKWATTVSLSTRVLPVLSCEGRIVRGRPRGSWLSSQYRWSVAPPVGDPLPEADAQAELARLWLARFGPASVDDLKWWAGWTVAATKRAVAAGGDVPDDVPADPGPWAALVPSLDPTTMGWKDRGWYLGDLGPQLFDRNGNAGPVIWWCGRIVGGWVQRPSGEVATRLLADVGGEGVAIVEAEAARLQAWLDASGAVVKPRFPTPLQKELSS